MDSEYRKHEAPEYPDFTCRICDITHFDLPYVRVPSEGKTVWAVCLPCASKCAEQCANILIMLAKESSNN